MALRSGHLSSKAVAASGTRSNTIGFQARGFTLIELAIAMSLVVLLAAIAWPLISDRITKAELPDSADRIRSMLVMTRSSAVMEHRRHRVRFEPGKQQPIIEYEVDPLRELGTWEPVSAAWSKEPVLLGDVQVHEVQIGRPVWTQPLASTDRPEDAGKDAQQEANNPPDRNTGQADITLLSPDAGMEDVEIDEDRPPIVFEVDGSSDWATLYLARVAPEDELKEEENQLWVVLDGRTAVARIQQKIDKETLADPEFYIARETLELPNTVDLQNLSLTSSSEEPDANVHTMDMTTGQSITELTTKTDVGGMLADTAGMNRRDGNSLGGTSGGTSNAGPPQNGRRTGRRGADGNVDGSRTGDRNGRRGDRQGEKKDLAAETSANESGLDQAAQDQMSKLEEALADSDMSEADKDEIRKMFEQSLRDHSGG